jgi:hypothetical protein
MSTRNRTLGFYCQLVAVGVLGSWAVAQEQRGAPSLRIPDGFGVNIHFTRAEPGELEALGPSGNRFIRMDFAWGGIERKKGEYDFSAFDRLVEDMGRLGVRCLFIFDYGNRLYDGGMAPSSDEGRAAFARYAAEGAKRYAGKGIIWEIWNEPNLAQFWKPKPNAEDYCKLSLAVIEAVRGADPKAYIVGPGSSGFPWEFLETMGKAGVIGKLDGVSVHPYRQQAPEMAEADYTRLRVLIDRHAGGKRLPILSGEWGYSMGWGGMSEEKQANYLPRQRLLNLACEVPVSIWYDWRDDGLDPKEPEHHFGTVFRDFKPKASYVAGKALAETLAGYEFVRRVATDSPKDYVLLFRKSEEAALAAWTTGEAHAVKLNVPPGEMAVVSRDGQRKTATAGKDGLELKLEPSPQYVLAPSSEAARGMVSWRPAQAMVIVRDAGNAVEVAVDGSGGKVEGELRVMVDQQELGKKSVNVDRNKQQVIRVPLQFARRDQAARLAQILFVPKNKKAAPGSALVWLLAPDPLKVSVLPSSGRTVVLMVENPSGRAVTMEMSVQSGPTTARFPAAIAAGQERAYITHMLANAPLRGAPIIVEALDSAGNVLVRSESARWSATAALTAMPEWRAGLGGDGKVAGSAKVEKVATDDKLLLSIGVAEAIELSYQFGDGWRYAEVYPAKASNLIVGKPTVVGMWVRGDGSGNTLRCKYRDSTGQIFQPTYGAVNWTGWRWITLPLSGQDAGHWGGANDGVVHYPIQWETVLLIDNMKHKIDQPLKIQAGGFAVEYDSW